MPVPVLRVITSYSIHYTKLYEVGADIALLARGAEALGVQTLPIELDVRDRVAVNAMADEVLSRFGRIDILVTCHGGSARERSTLFCA